MKNNPSVNFICGLVGMFGLCVVYTSTRETVVSQWLLHFGIGVAIVCVAGAMHKVLSK